MYKDIHQNYNESEITVKQCENEEEGEISEN